jgi:hypothetical protein
MVKETPLRLVAIEERPDDERDSSAAPVDIMSDADAITRRVPDSEQIAAHETARDKTPSAGLVPRSAQAKVPSPGRSPRKRGLVVAIAGAAIGTAAIMAWVSHGRTVAAKGPSGDAAAKVSVPTEAAKPMPVTVPVPSVVPVAAAPARTKLAAEIIRLEISADPVEAELSLDGNLLAGHRLNLEVPRDQGIHIVSASAPGYVPFNQQVSFSSDVVLKISLRRAHVSSSHQVGARSRSRPEVRQKADGKPAVEQPVRGFNPGMHLEGPPTRPAARQIDERNPYKP